MPGFYPKGELELVGFGVGVVERDKVIDGSIDRRRRRADRARQQRPAQQRLLAGAPHRGRGHRAGKFDLRDAPPELNQSLASRAARADAHLREAGAEPDARLRDPRRRAHHRRRLRRNLPRILPKGVRARIDPRAWPRPPIFDFLARHGEIPETGDARRLQLRDRHDPGRASRAGRGHAPATRRHGRARVPHRRDRAEAGRRGPPCSSRTRPEAAADGVAPRWAATRRELRARRWDVRRARRRARRARGGGAARHAPALRVCVVEEDEAARRRSFLREPFFLAGARAEQARSTVRCASSACRRSSGATS